MPSRIALVHDQSDLLNAVSAGLTRAGHAVARFTEPMAALKVLDTTAFKLLITRVNFEHHTIHGVALANMAKRKHPDLQVLFVAPPEMRAYAGDVGRLLETPVTVHHVLEVAEELLTPLPL